MPAATPHCRLISGPELHVARPDTSAGREVPPHLFLGLTDGTRATWDLGWFLVARWWLARREPADGRPVLVLPGLHAGDWSTRPLRGLLAQLGYQPYGWGLGTNIGPTRKAMDGLDRRLTAIRAHHGQPISIIGQSLGGYMGAEMARRHPGDVDRLIALGAPLMMTSLGQSRAGRGYTRHRAMHLPEYAFEQWRTAPRPDIPITSIYSRLDGIVHWRACRFSEGERVENIEVLSSHLGMAVQPPAVYAVLDRLAVSLTDWKPFEPGRYLGIAYRGTSQATQRPT